MESKRTNLCLSVDVTTCNQLLHLADIIGPEICVLKTHVDILVDFNEEFVQKLTELARKHRFMIFEDRKFADIGNTVYHQYSAGIYKIASWADITNCHTVPGDGIVKGLMKAANEVPDDRALLILAEMSSAGSLATGEYTNASIEMAKRGREDFVIGFVAGRRLVRDDQDDFIYFSPGVQLEKGTDQLGQQYRTPEMVLGQECLSDIVIVGRGICNAADPVSEAKTYRKKCWEAYQNRL